jgi:hypothetical protein
VPFTASCAFLMLLFPDGRLPSRRWLPFAWLVGIATVALATVAALWPGPTCEVCPIDNPLGIEALEGVSALDFALMETLFYVLGLPAMGSLYLRFRRASSVERQQIKWFAYAGSVVVLGAICRSFLGNIVHSATGAWWAFWLGQGILTVGFAGTAIAMSIAILKYRLYEIDILINPDRWAARESLPESIHEWRWGWVAKSRWLIPLSAHPLEKSASDFRATSIHRLPSW